MHAQYFALIKLNWQLQFCAIASFSLSLILLVPHDVLPLLARQGDALHLQRNWFPDPIQVIDKL